VRSLKFIAQVFETRSNPHIKNNLRNDRQLECGEHCAAMMLLSLLSSRINIILSSLFTRFVISKCSVMIILQSAYKHISFFPVMGNS